MTMTVRGLLQRPRLQLKLVGGAKGLDREVTWAHVSDLAAPWDFLGPSELLLTNGTGLGMAPDAQVQFVERLARIGASGLVVGLGTGGAPVTDALADRSGELELPLLTVPYSIRFSDIVRTVAENSGRDASVPLDDVAQFYDLLRLSLAAGDLGPATFDALGRQLGLQLHLVDVETGASVFDDEPLYWQAPAARSADVSPRSAQLPLGEVLARSVAEHGHHIPGLLQLSRDGSADGEVCALAVAVPGEPLTALVAEPLGDRLPSAAVLQHVAVAGAVQLAQIVSRRQRHRRQGGELLDQLLDPRRAWRVASDDPGLCGLDFGSCVLAVLRPVRPAAEDALHRALSRAHLTSLLVQRGEQLYAVLPQEAVASQLEPQLGELGCSAGVSDLLGSADRMRDAAQEAAWALSVTEANGAPLSRYGDGAGLLMPRTPAEAQALVDHVLGELLAYDRAHGTAYVETVRAFVRADGSWQQAAAVVHVHKQTLGYRLRKVEELTGRGFARTAHMAEWWFALQAFDLLTACRKALADVPPAAPIGSAQRQRVNVVVAA
ncbi:MAG TPA: PucR family transcriptional regulator ligand-binding domain-containing protein [Streptosporangiaceae bacterium]|nr:PucR family transcriptional regulator ligand-binding domain-containing protein [Streptosporangiaceae bacterium]